MFLALRDLKAAKGRFALITVTVAMMALLVSFLSGLTGGLVHQNISSLDVVRGSGAQVAYVADENLDRSTFTVPSSLLDAQPATAVGISRGQVQGQNFAVLGVRAGAHGPASDATPLPAAGHVVLSQPVATALDAHQGDTLTLNNSSVVVDAIAGDDWYAHQEVIWTHLADEQPATFVVADGPEQTIPGLTALKAKKLQDTIASYKAESTSLTMINVMLLIITALVTGAFFTVWTIQRKPDIATLKALGATTSALVVDALGQATIILALGIGAGLAITLGASALIGGAMPFVVSPGTTVVPAAGMFALGLLGAGLSLTFLRTASALSALGGNR
ncbi:ABC transporter substrate-binding protein [Corynebacterium sp. 13CS0277]|uniref:FtsX-like permease family protein n=1 Tax=Corynebacterium sp. 13CS0277 TaxID=2071994 RepID=UPI000D044B72|nr:ABC transporter permease [Corynebacterium sp. 13CS0277]PRQ12587.1 ABC transporter substrate-binding protein [Corynebacterium sp. 13CS0277]